VSYTKPRQFLCALLLADSSASVAVAPGTKTEVPLVPEGGVLRVPVTLNGVIALTFVVDSGAADVVMPADVVMTLTRTGTLAAADFIGTRNYRLADGSTVPSRTFRIRTLKVGNRVIENVTGSMTGVEGTLLLGQSFLGRFQRWSINNSKQALELE
jgi:predicted aspartyl protease